MKLGLFDIVVMKIFHRVFYPAQRKKLFRFRYELEESDDFKVWRKYKLVEIENVANSQPRKTNYKLA